MANIQVLDKNTIDQIAAGEVIERPLAVVKELVENAIDAGATAIAVEIKDGGVGFIRITDNGSGIEKDQVEVAFKRHATSKIRTAEDLIGVVSLGFRGEALSSISAIAQVELITKTAGSATGCRYVIEGGEEKTLEDIGAPEGTTFIIRNLFYNTPARRKFLKSPKTEAGYISDVVERLALSHPEISFKFINNNQTKLHTSGNSNLKDIIYHIYGREIASNMIGIDSEMDGVKVTGFIGNPTVSRGNRNFENYFINSRYVKSSIIAKGIEEGYKSFMMQHKYPFTVLHFEIDGSFIDVNVHPTKMELRFSNQEEVYDFISTTVQRALTEKELIPAVTLDDKKVEKPKTKIDNFLDALSSGGKEQKPKPARYAAPDKVPGTAKQESFQEQVPEEMDQEYFIKAMKQRVMAYHNARNAKSTLNKVQETAEYGDSAAVSKQDAASEPVEQKITSKPAVPAASPAEEPEHLAEKPEQLHLFEDKLLTEEAKSEHRMIGQVFGTYWLIEYHEKLFIIDQHAAHEKVLYERMVKELKEKQHTSQMMDPPIILTLSMQEEELMQKYIDNFTAIGFEIEPFGGKDYAIRGVPGNLFHVATKDLLIEMLDGLSTETGGRDTPDIINEKLASMSCKAAVKGNHRFSVAEAEKLIDELLTLENPYNCPHGRPTIISMTKYEMEKKFKRIV